MAISLQTNHSYPMPEPECYIYFHHTGEYIVLPTYPDQLSDSQQVTFTSSTPLGRSAPIFSYQNSGPRSIQFTFELHRDMMWQLNYTNASLDKGNLGSTTTGDDYVDIMIKKIQGAALPEYSMSSKMVSPPIVSVSIGKDIFIKGVVNGSVGIVYKPPILDTQKYACVNITFTVFEVIPYSASKAMQLGGFRNMDYTLDTNNTYVVSSAAAAGQAQYFANGGIGAEGTEGGSGMTSGQARALQRMHYRNGNIGVDEY